MAAATHHTLVTVNRNPGSRRLARYWISDIEEPHWHYDSGGSGKRSRRPSLFGYVYCTGMVDGEVAHSGLHGGPCPHRIVVHIPAKHNDPGVMEYLRGVAGAKPGSRRDLNDFLLAETGDFLLTETGDRILLEGNGPRRRRISES